MQNKPQLPPQRTGGVLPPLSKYYYGPAVSPEQPSAQQDSRWLASSAQQNPPALPPRILPSSTPSDQSQHRSTFENGSAQAWQSSGTPPPAPFSDEVAQWAYNPSTSSPPPTLRYAPSTSTLNQSSQPIGRTDPSEWPVNDYQDSGWGRKPPLPAVFDPEPKPGPTSVRVSTSIVATEGRELSL
ncbi:MAG: hypothetical protein Q9214_001380 [Letrouitia sp. 1 TL-2023]